MPRFSAFTPFGALAFSSRPAHGQKFYEEMVKALGSGKNFSDDFDSLAMGRVYAFAMAFGRCLYTLERASTQFQPARALELLPALESEYGLIPEPGAGIPERRNDLGVATRVARGARRSNVEDIMAALFATDFVEYFTVPIAGAVVTTGSPDAIGSYDAPGTRRAAFKLLSPVTSTGVLVTVFAKFLAGDLEALQPGARIVVDPGDYGRVECVRVVDTAVVNVNQLQINAVFTKAHAAGTVVASGRHANLTGNKRHNLFIMTAAAVRTNKTRRKLNRAAARLLRGVSTWSLTDGSGPFRVGEGRLGVTTIGTVT